MKKNIFKTILLPIGIIMLLIVSCQKDSTNQETQNNIEPVLEGGKGGNYSIAIFSTHNGAGIKSKIFLKYAANKKPSDVSLYDDSDSTMIEPGYGPHVHFNGLKIGTYFVYLSSASLSAEKIIQITDSSKQSDDIYIELK